MRMSRIVSERQTVMIRNSIKTLDRASPKFDETNERAK